MSQPSSSTFCILPIGLVFDDDQTGERAEIVAPGIAIYRTSHEVEPETVTISRGRALYWALRVHEALAGAQPGCLWGPVGQTLERELQLGKWGLFALSSN